MPCKQRKEGGKGHTKKKAKKKKTEDIKPHNITTAYKIVRPKTLEQNQQTRTVNFRSKPYLYWRNGYSSARENGATSFFHITQLW